MDKNIEQLKAQIEKISAQLKNLKSNSGMLPISSSISKERIGLEKKDYLSKELDNSPEAVKKYIDNTEILADEISNISYNELEKKIDKMF